jgi:DNA-binding transcriptional LysR family regulator
MNMQKVHDEPDAHPLPTGALATFLAVHHAGTISGAATRLHLSQPAVSRRLQALERHLGVDVFDRVLGRLRLTDAGRALLPHAERSRAAEIDAVRAATDRRDPLDGTVTLGVVGSLVELYVTDAFKTAIRRHPATEIEVTTATSSQIRDLVRRGDVELGVSYAQPVDDDLDVEVIALERLLVVCATDHLLAGGRLAVDELGHHRWLVFPERASHPETSGTIALRTLERHHVAPNRLRPIDSLSAQRSLAIAGYGLALLPASMVTADLRAGLLATVEVEALEIEAPITLIRRTGAHVGPAAQMMVELLRSRAARRGDH